jgi:hypothetical protein
MGAGGKLALRFITDADEGASARDAGGKFSIFFFDREKDRHWISRPVSNRIFRIETINSEFPFKSQSH